MSKKFGFTLVELLAVIVILAIILAIAIPSISNLINDTTKGAFESDAKLLLKAIEYKVLEDETFNPSTINETNIDTLLNVESENYEKITVQKIIDELYITIEGKNKWDKLVAFGNKNKIEVSSKIIHDGLVLWLDGYDFTNNLPTQTWIDRSGNSHHGIPSGFNYTTLSGSNGLGGLVLDGVDDKITLDNSTGDVFPLTVATFSFVISDNMSAGTGYELLRARPYNGIKIYSNKIDLWHNDSAIAINVVPPSGIYQLDIVVGSEGTVLYINGARVGINTSIKSLTVPNYNLTPFVISNKGVYRDICIYNRALTDSEILHNYNALKQKY